MNEIIACMVLISHYKDRILPPNAAPAPEQISSGGSWKRKLKNMVNFAA